MSKNFENGIISSSDSGADFLAADIEITGDVHWVDSVNGDDSNDGSELKPLASLTQAITNATANNGDVIVIKSASTFTSATSIALSKAGVRVFGLGTGSTKPTFTVSGNVDLLDLTAESVEINNLRFAAGSAAHTARVNVGAAGARIENCDFLCGANDLNSITIPDAGDYCTIKGCTFTITADGPDNAIEVEAAAVLGLRVEGCTFDGGDHGFDEGGLYSAVAHLNHVYLENTLTAASIVHTAAAKGICSGTIAGDGAYVRI